MLAHPKTYDRSAYEKSGSTYENNRVTYEPLRKMNRDTLHTVHALTET